MLIYFNPECSKCNETLSILNQNNCSVQIRNYLTEPPSVEELKQLTALIKCSPLEITRTKENLFRENFLNKLKDDEDWFVMLSQNPTLIERPIVVSGNRAIIGRPPELVKSLI